MSNLTDVQLTLVESMQDVEAFMRWLGERRSLLALDTETSGLSLGTDRLRLVQFGDTQQGWAIPYGDWRGLVKHVMDTYEGKFVLQHAKFDAGFLMRDGVSFPWERVHDTLPMCFVADSLGPKGLKKAAAWYVDPSAQNGEKALKKAMMKGRWDYGTVPITLPEYWAYGALDTVLTARLADVLWPRVQYARRAYDLELACERVLGNMEQRGVTIDLDYCYKMEEDLESQIADVMGMLGGLNPSAPQDVVAALQAEGCRLAKRTPSGNYAVDDEVLSELAAKGSNIAKNVLRARYLNKVSSSYFTNFIDYNVDGVLHPQINQLAARTGRMSVTRPALQTIPRTALVRDAFVPREGNSLVLIDYDAQELRVAAHVGQDENMIQAFREGRDMHAETAQALYGANWTKANRSTAKNAMYSYCYGGGAEKFAKTAGVPFHEAHAVFETLKRLYPGIARGMAQAVRVVRERTDENGFGYVQALNDGRRLKVSVDKAYAGLNTLIQGSCAVVLKRALVDLDAAGLGEYLALPIHDEVMFDVPDDELEEVVPVALEVMRRDDFAAPLTVGSKIVKRWGEAYE